MPKTHPDFMPKLGLYMFTSRDSQVFLNQIERLGINLTDTAGHANIILCDSAESALEASRSFASDKMILLWESVEITYGTGKGNIHSISGDNLHSWIGVYARAMNCKAYLRALSILTSVSEENRKAHECAQS